MRKSVISATAGILSLLTWARPAASWVAKLLGWYSIHKPEVDDAAVAIVKLEQAAQELGAGYMLSLRTIQQHAKHHAI